MKEPVALETAQRDELPEPIDNGSIVANWLLGRTAPATRVDARGV
jgi:hypothetical protein